MQNVIFFNANRCLVGLVWCGGAVGFWKAEAKSQGLSYFQALYFCYVSLLTIGYGDLSPKSNAGKPFFILWSLVAVPTMTILITDMGGTVIASFKRGTFRLADWTVLPKAGVWRIFIEKHPWLKHWLQEKAEKADQRIQDEAALKRMSEGFPAGPADEDMNAPGPTLEDIAEEEEDEEEEEEGEGTATTATTKNHHRHHDTLGHRLALALRRTAHDLTAEHARHYSYEEWVEFTRLIRFTRLTKAELEEAEEEEGLVEWDWIGEDSPMLADESESEWLLLRLCESLDRYMRMTSDVEIRRQKQWLREGAGEKKEREEGTVQELGGSSGVRKVKKRQTR